MASARLALPRTVAECVGRIRATEPDIRAWAHFDPERALTLRTANPDGSLAGLPVGVKDVIDTSDMPTEYGSALYRGHQPQADAACVTRLRNAGAIVIGKTVTTEFASVAPSITRNPRNLGHTPGGSSSGSAAAVAAGMVPVALGTQTAGSIIRPASYCGVVGFKPSFALADRSGVKTLAASFDTVGVFAASVADAAAIAAVICDRPDLTRTDDHSPVIGVYLPPWAVDAEPCVIDALSAAAAAAERQGTVVRTIRSIDGFDRLLAAHQAVMDIDMTRALAREMAHPDQLDPVTLRQLADRAKRANQSSYDEAQEFLTGLRKSLPSMMMGCDVLLAPSAAGEAPEGLASTGSSDFSRGFTALHGPCITIPGGFGPKGLPIGVQIVASPGRDRTVLSAAAMLERALMM